MQKFFAPKTAAALPPIEGALDPHRLSQCSNAGARAVLPFEQAMKLSLLPLGLIRTPQGEVLIAACADVPNLQLQSVIKFICGLESRLVQAERGVLQQAIHFAYLGNEETLQSCVQEIRAAHQHDINSDKLELELRNATGEAAKLLSTLVDYALSHAATDLHLIPLADGYHVKLRINGQLRSHPKALCAHVPGRQIVNRIKVLASLDISKKELPQDGTLRVHLGSTSAHLRVATMPTLHGEKLSLRFHHAMLARSIEQLGLPAAVVTLLQDYAAQREGALLICGPTGSGKTTTLYAILGELCARNLNCVTLEDPVEVQIPGVAQCAVNSSQGLTFAAGLRAVLRQDPDAIMLGEIRDSESARVALQSAMTGHLLLATLHARNHFEILLRLEHLGVDALTIFQACSLFLCQRLLPTLCTNCKVLDLSASNNLQYEIYKEVGCQQCDYSGYSGQLLLCDALQLNQAWLELACAAQRAKLAAALAERSTILQQAKNALMQGKIGANQFASLNSRS